MNGPAQLALGLCLGGCFWLCHGPAAAVQATVTLGDLVQTYDGSPKLPTVTTEPPGLGVSWRFVDPAAGAPQPVSETVFRSAPATLALSYQSLAFNAQKVWGYGDHVRLAGVARNLESVDVVMVTWALAANYPALAAADPAGWRHPVTLTVYSMSGGLLGFRGEVTREVFVPWRPLTLPDGQPYPHNGHAFMAHFDFPAGLTLPEQPVFLVSFNTQTTGFEPISGSGPYNELNVAAGGSASIGSDMDKTKVLTVRSATYWPYSDQGIAAPMLVVKANRIPEPGTEEPPVRAGRWRATAKIADPGYEGDASADFTIQPARASVALEGLVQTYDGGTKQVAVATDPPGLPVLLTFDGTTEAPVAAGTYPVVATVDDPNHEGGANATLVIHKAPAIVGFSGLVQVFDGRPKPVAVSTEPAFLTVSVTYGGSLAAPVARGRYAVRAEVDDPNHEGLAAGELWIGHDLASWLDPWVERGAIGAGATGEDDDPDGDRTCNLLEYAWGLDPASAGHGMADRGTPRVEWTEAGLALVYRRNTTATDLVYQVETATRLDVPESWVPIASADTVLGIEGGVETVRAVLPPNPGEAARFVRLMVKRR